MDCLLLCENSDEETSSNCSVSGEKYFPKKWCSPWGCSAVVDDVVPLFNHILRENYASSSNIPDEDTEKNRQVWWSWRESLDKCYVNYSGWFAILRHYYPCLCKRLGSLVTRMTPDCFISPFCFLWLFPFFGAGGGG